MNDLNDSMAAAQFKTGQCWARQGKAREDKTRQDKRDGKASGRMQ